MSREPIEKRFFFHIHPLAATVYFAELISLLLFFNHLSIVATSFLLITFLNWDYLGGQRVWQQLKIDFWVFLVIVAFNVLLNQSGRPYIWQITFFNVSFKLSLPALLYGSVMGLMLVEMLMMFALLNAILTTNKLLAVFSPVSPRFALLVVLSVNLVGTFTRQFKQLVMYQKTRNVALKVGSPKQRVETGMHFLNLLLETSLAAGMEKAQSMDARGFGATKRSHYQAFRWQTGDSGFMAVTSLVFLGLLGLRIASFGWTTSALDFNWTFPITDGWISGLFAGFLLMPIIFERATDLWIN